MFHAALPDFFAVSMIFFGAGAVKGILGMGLPTVAMGLLGLVMPLAGAASLLTLPSLVTNAWQAAVGPGLSSLVKRLWTLQAGIVAGVLVTPVLLPGPQDALARKLLATCLIAYGLLGLLGWRPPRISTRWEGVAGLTAGAATGVITGLTGVFVLPAVPYLQSLELPKDHLAQALGLSFTTSTLALAGVLAVQGHLDLGRSTGSLLMVLPALAGMFLGQMVRGGMSEPLFRRCFFAGLLLLGAGQLLP